MPVHPDNFISARRFSADKTVKLFLQFVTLFFCLFSSATSESHQSKSIFHLLIINSQQGEPYSTVKQSALKHLGEIGSRQNFKLAYKEYSIGNYEGTVINILKAESTVHYEAVLLNGTMALIGAKKYYGISGQLPFVFASVTDPIGIGAIKSFEKPPAGNFTGVTYPVPVEERLRFIASNLPEARTLGLIYADMPQSHSYNRWLEAALQQPEFQNFKLVKRMIPFIPSDGGHIRMAQLAKKEVQALDPVVDVFLSPNDQMGVQQPFVETVFNNSSKPLLGIGKRDVTEGWGAALSIYPSLESMGKIAADMLWRIYNGEKISTILPERPQSGKAYNLALCKKFGIVLPETAGTDSKFIILE